ncbi:MAG TPA: leucine-rich repeat domain-containing protein, partial [Cytophagales bacterium]|nr:leucine-rich repeat domain-containing protein [Cytophagales bacterium]
MNQLLSGELRETKRLKIATGLTEFPQEIFTLADTLEILDLTDNNISQLPADFGRLYKLKIVFFSNNAFERFPEVLAQCPDLEMIGFKANKIAVVPEGALPSKTRWLILTDNRITVLPKSIGLCHRMQKLMLAGNRLQELPVELSACENLELLRISANRFEVLPQWLFSLPKLSWLAIAGNPCTQILSSENSIQYIPWNELLLQKTLGEGASGVISMA